MLLFLLAVISFLIATAQGIIYYQDYDSFFKCLLVLQNSINAFGFKASVSINDTISFMEDNRSALTQCVGYAYCIAVFTAPYCTLSFVYKILGRLLRFIILFRRRRNYRHIVVFGYNSDVKAMLNNNKSSLKKTCIHIVTTELIGSEEIYRLNRAGYIVHYADILKAAESELHTLLAKTHIELATNIILFESSSIRNFSLLQLFRLNDSDSDERIRLAQGAKVSCRCEEEGIGRLIAEYYNNAAGTDACYDLELVGLPELQIHKMYSDHPLHTVYKDTDKPLKDWTVHLLVAGFGQLGQQAVLQAVQVQLAAARNIQDAFLLEKFEFGRGEVICVTGSGKNTSFLRDDLHTDSRTFKCGAVLCIDRNHAKQNAALPCHCFDVEQLDCHFNKLIFGVRLEVIEQVRDD